MKATRNKEETKSKLVEAVGRIILREGFSSLGINTVAKEAGVDKVLIYRYFENLDGLLKTYVMSKDYFANIIIYEDELNQADIQQEVVAIAKKIFTGQLKEILTNKELQEIVLWELTTKNEITVQLAKKREARGVKLFNSILTKLENPKADVHAAASIILGGINYLVLRSRHVEVFNGIKLNSPKGWKRIEKSLEELIDLVLN